VPREAGVIAVRRAEPSDYEALCAVYSDESAYSGTLQLPYPSAEIWRKRLAEPKLDEFSLVALVGGRIVGSAGLHRTAQSPRRAHAMLLGMAVMSEHQGRGVGNALMKALLEIADGWLTVTRLELTVFTDNERAIALYRKHGFELEGTHKAYALRGGRYADVHCMARIRQKV
jgi:putative acetyltransferase